VTEINIEGGGRGGGALCDVTDTIKKVTKELITKWFPGIFSNTFSVAGRSF